MLASVGVVGRRWKCQIQSQLKGLLEQIRYNSIEDRTAAIKTRIGVDLDEPGL